MAHALAVHVGQRVPYVETHLQQLLLLAQKQQRQKKNSGHNRFSWLCNTSHDTAMLGKHIAGTH
jgi:hypothetical protein